MIIDIWMIQKRIGENVIQSNETTIDFFGKISTLHVGENMKMQQYKNEIDEII